MKYEIFTKAFYVTDPNVEPYIMVLLKSFDRSL